MYKQLLLLITISIFLFSCGAKRGTAKIEEAAVSKVISLHKASEPEFRTMSSRMKLNYTDEERSQSVTVSYRMQKDSAIWISAQILGIPLAKALITREGVSYYEKIGKTYFVGDFGLLSKWVGTPLDFVKLQNLLLGQSVYDLREERYQLTESTRGYQLIPSVEMQAIKKVFLLDPNTYKAIAQQLSQEKVNRHVTVTYPAYQQVRGQTLPEQIKIVASDRGQISQIEIEIRSVSLNSAVSFPFDIPSGYEKIILD